MALYYLLFIFVIISIWALIVFFITDDTTEDEKDGRSL